MLAFVFPVYAWDPDASGRRQPGVGSERGRRSGRRASGRCLGPRRCLRRVGRGGLALGDHLARARPAPELRHSGRTRFRGGSRRRGRAERRRRIHNAVGVSLTRNRADHGLEGPPRRPYPSSPGERKCNVRAGREGPPPNSRKPLENKQLGSFGHALPAPLERSDSRIALRCPE